MNEKNIETKEELKCIACGNTGFMNHDGEFAVCICGVSTRYNEK